MCKKIIASILSILMFSFVFLCSNESFSEENGKYLCSADVICTHLPGNYSKIVTGSGEAWKKSDAIVTASRDAAMKCVEEHGMSDVSVYNIRCTHIPGERR